MRAYYSNSQPMLPDIIKSHGKWMGTKEALVTPLVRLSWQELNTITDTVADYLYTIGVRRDDRVGFVMGNGAPMVISLIAAMKVGAVSVPINLSVSNDTIAALLADADIKSVILTEKHADRYSPVSADIFTLVMPEDGSVPDDYMGEGGVHKAESPHAETLMNIIYSSGTTGTPKGIAHTHIGRLNWTYDIALALRYHANSRTIFTVGLYSNISWVGFLSTLLLGGTLVIQPAFDANSTLDLMTRERITNGSMVPLQYQRLLDNDPNNSFDARHLIALMSCGSPLPIALKKRLFKAWGPKVIELYGLTEGLITTLQPEDAFAGRDSRLKSVGKPLPGTDIKLLDAHDVEVTRGSAGEIVGTGRITMPGYWRRQEASQISSWTAPDGSIWLRTGDIGVLDEDGFLTLVDRKKDMILSGGQNIYPLDIEQIALTLPEIADIAVIGAKSRTWGETPIAFVALQPEALGANCDPDAIKNTLNALLGKQQRLKDLEILPEIPRNPAGKILKTQLRERVRDRVYD